MTDRPTTMHRRTFLTLATASTATLAAGPALAASNGDGFDALLKAGSRDDLSAAARIAALEASGFAPVQGDERARAAAIVGDSLSMFDIRPLSGAPTSAAFHHASRINTRANIDRPSGGGRTSSLLRFDEPAGRVYAYLLQGTANGRITFTAACEAQDSVTAFLSRYIDDLPARPAPGVGFDRAEFGRQPTSRPVTKRRLIITRIDIPAIRAITGSDFNAAGNFLIKTNPA